MFRKSDEKFCISMSSTRILLREVVVGDDRRDGGEQAEGRGHERAADARRHRGEVGVAEPADVLKRVHDADDRAEQADEGRGRAGGGEERHERLEVA